MKDRPSDQPRYTVLRVFDAADPGIAWATVPAAAVEHFHPRSRYQPGVQARAVYDEHAIRVRFDVDDRYVRSIHTEHNSAVCQDSCVEFFFRPVGCEGYLNFEANCGGTLHASFIPMPDGAAPFSHECRFLSRELGSRVVVARSMPATVQPEITERCQWHLEMLIRWAVVHRLSAAAAPRPGDVWTGNFYKCGDWTSHPHWGSWAPMDDRLNFHRPELFGQLIFGT